MPIRREFYLIVEKNFPRCIVNESNKYYATNNDMYRYKMMMIRRIPIEKIMIITSILSRERIDL